MIKKVPDQWKEYRRRSRIASFGLVLGLPAVTAIAIAIKLWFPINAEDVFIGLAITWAIIWVWSAFCVVRWPCPRCGVAWLSHQGAEIGAKRCCAHCGLCLYEQP